MDKHKIMWMGDSPLLPTGFSNQMRNICMRLAKLPDYEVFYYAWAFQGRPMYCNFENMMLSRNPQDNSFLLLPHSMRTQWGDDLLLPYLNEYKPDLFCTLADTFMLTYFLKLDFAPFKTLVYFPSDGRPLPLQGDQVLKKVQYPVAMSRYARDQAIDLYGINNCDLILHGVDTKFFHPVANKAELRAIWSKRLNINLQDKFIVGAVARFQGRKDVPGMIKAFADFAKDKPDAVLLLHMDPQDPAASGLWIYDIINRYNVGAKIAFTGMKWFKGFSEEELQQFYNLLDCQFSKTTGEGFGITTIEGHACEVPIVITDYTTTKELVIEPEAGLGIPLAEEIFGTYNVMRAFADQKKCAEALQYYYDNRAVMKQHGKNGRKFVVENCDWDSVIFKKWLKKFEEILQ